MSIMIIAEAGSNHNGSMKRAKDLVMAAAQIGASSIKFQFIFADGLYLPKYLDDDKYIINSVYDIRKSEELAKNQWSEIWSEANDNNIDISASVFCSQGVKLLSFLGANFVKISSTDLTNIRLIEEACDNFDTVIISTGMSSIDEIYKTVNFISGQYNKTNLKLMHCVSVYPCDLKESNISRIKVLKDYFGLEVGYSDHTETEISAVLALMSGASFFEKHFTTNKNLSGFDHKYALDPNEFKKYIDVLNNSSLAISSIPFTINEKEQVTKIRARRGVYVNKDLSAGHVLTKEDLLYVRPSSQFSCDDPKIFIGKIIEQDIPQYSALGISKKAVTVKSNWKDANKYWQNEMQEKKMRRNGKNK
jgi:N,N'-diacetyllegionaminate synthase